MPAIAGSSFETYFVGRYRAYYEFSNPIAPGHPWIIQGDRDKIAGCGFGDQDGFRKELKAQKSFRRVD